MAATSAALGVGNRLHEQQWQQRNALSTTV
jgi:hypothetical protein